MVEQGAENSALARDSSSLPPSLPLLSIPFDWLQPFLAFCLVRYLTYAHSYLLGDSNFVLAR